jgi:5-deoxy-glucuronate isomerase
MDLPIQRLVMGETINPPGNWSSYPPHKHDEEFPPEEAVFEEVYHFLLKPEQGFGFIRLYDPPRRKDRMDEVFVIQNGDTVVIPHGYHPVTVAPGYQIFYLFSLAGEKRQYGAWRDDPNHHWVRSLAQ